MTSPDGNSLGPLKMRDGEPAFQEVWQAQVLALADALVAAGTIEATAWSQALGNELATAEIAGTADTPQTYYEAALRALETLLDQTNTVPAPLLVEREEAWRHAYLSTPHGSPVELSE